MVGRSRPREDRLGLGRARLFRILRVLKVALRNTLEMKISEAGPYGQRIDPLPLTDARNSLIDDGHLKIRKRKGVHWFHLSETPLEQVNARLKILGPIQDRLSRQKLGMRKGQALEIAVFRSLNDQTNLDFMGQYYDLDTHDDDQRYRKEEPPSAYSGKYIPGNETLDFLVVHKDVGLAGIEVKNIREWLYIDRDEVKDLLFKCCHLDAVPVLIARRIPFVTHKLLHLSGVITHETYNQRFAAADHELAAKARDRNLLGYHDIRLGNEPDARLNKFIHQNLPTVLPRMREQFDQYKDLLFPYATGEMPYEEFAGRALRRSRGEPEDFGLDGWE